MDPEQNSFVQTFRTFLEEVVYAAQRDSKRTPLGELVEQHLGVDVSDLPVVTEAILSHRLVDADLALTELGSRGETRLIGISHGQMRMQEDLPGLLTHAHVAFDLGPLDYTSIATGPDTERRVVACGLHLMRYRNRPIAVLQRAARPEFHQSSARVEVLALDTDLAGDFIHELRELMVRLSVLRGQVLALTGNEYSNGAAGASFLVRPTVGADDIVLAEGTLERITRHVVGIGDHRARLVAAGQHLKRGVLLYGPPGTGKTLTVRHLLARTPGTTAVLLTGPSIRFITEAAELARAMQPALVVLEDVDLVAGDRSMHGGPQPLLFAVLDALDGLDGDADVTFLLTTNRVELLERALAERPGRVDLAVEIGLPDAAARRLLFALYARGLPLGEQAIADAADLAEGVTGAFAKELMRRAVLTAAEDGREVADADLATSLDELLSAREELTRSLLGAGGPDGGAGGSDPFDGGHVHFGGSY